MASLFGINSENFPNKSVTVEKVANTLLPISLLAYSHATNNDVILVSATGSTILTLFDISRSVIQTEVTRENNVYINVPPNDVRISNADCTMFMECKTIMFKSAKTELILRQDCFSCNSIINIVEANKPFGKTQFTCIDEILSEPGIIETPYLFILLWKECGTRITCDMLVITDVGMLQLIKDADTPRSKEAIVLINNCLRQYNESGKIIYKPLRQSTVKHQKVSLFPFRDSEYLQKMKFDIDMSEIVNGIIKPDTTLWHKLEVTKLRQTIDELTEELAKTKVTTRTTVVESDKNNDILNVLEQLKLDC